MKKKKNWFRLKRYPHIGLPLENKDRLFAASYVKNKKNIASHPFYPLIHREISVRKFRRKKFDDGTRSSDRYISYKNREVYYATHLDALVYGYYAELLNKAYEKYLKGKPVSHAITAYRGIKFNNKPKARNKCNIDFANDIFTYIKKHSDKKLAALTFDITSFFDNLDHHLLKKAWCQILQLKESDGLPPDHYNVYRNLTKFSYIEATDIFEEFKDDIVVKKKNGDLTRQAVPHFDLLKEKNAVAYCYVEDFDKRIRKKGLIKNNKRIKGANGKFVLRRKGIPQGSPISSVLSNIYMINFDIEINQFVENLGGLYKRYSDDMVVVIPEENLQTVLDKFYNEITNYKLEIQPAKTQVFLFKEFNGNYGCKELNLKTNNLLENRTFDYLGFSFDGKNAYLKSSGLAKYYRKMKRSFRRGAYYAKYGKNKEPVLFKGRLYKRFSHLGASRRKIYKKDPKTGKWNESEKYDWGNFLTYAELAENVFKNGKIKHQVRNSWKIFHELMAKKEQEIKSYYEEKEGKKAKGKA